MMMKQELLHQPSWPLYNLINYQQIDGHVGDQEFSFSFTTSEDSSGISSDQFLSTVFSDEFPQIPMSSDEEFQVTSMENTPDDMEGIDSILGDDFDEVCRWLGEGESEENLSFPSTNLQMESDEIWSPCQPTKSSEASMVLPVNEIKNDSQLGLKHLLKAYGEAMEMEQRELAEVINQCIIGKVSSVGETLERLAFNLFQGQQEEYLKQESSKNFEAAFKAFYQIFPYGRFAHFTANLAILKAMPNHTETIHIVDFAAREGVQWAPMIEAIASLRKELRLTLIKSGEDCEETKRRLCNHAKSCGLNMKVEEVGIEELVSEIKKMRKRGGRREFLAFNCMMGLPHMGKGRSRSQVIEFLRVAKELLANSETDQGIITIGDGDAGERLRSCSGFSSFFDGCLNHYQALCESMEWNFPVCFAEARIAMESLFVAPLVSSLSWIQKWEEVREGSDLHTGLKGLRLAKESLIEAKELVREGESSYAVRIEGQNQNEMVLEWRGTPLVSVSTWR